MAITKEQAEEFLRQDIATAENIVNAECLSLSQCQFDVLVSFVFNVGGDNFRKSTLLTKVKANPDDNSIMDEILRWVYAKGVVLLGLRKRRVAEVRLYFSEGYRMETLTFIGTYIIPLFTAAVGWFVGSRKRKNDFLKYLQVSINLLSAKNKRLLEEITNANAEIVAVRKENEELKVPSIGYAQRTRN